jgi:hypothetical protein
MKCPLCGKEMTRMNETMENVAEPALKKEVLYYCERHGVINKATDLKEKADQIARQV